MELTPLERLLYEVDPLGTAEEYTLTLVQLETLLESDADHADCVDECDCYQRGWADAVEEAVSAVRSL